MKDALIIKPNRRRFDPESEFFLMGNIERFQAFRNRNSTINIWADDTNWIVDLAATADRIFKCLEAGCCQEFNSIRKVSVIPKCEYHLISTYVYWYFVVYSLRNISSSAIAISAQCATGVSPQIACSHSTFRNFTIATLLLCRKRDRHMRAWWKAVRTSSGVIRIAESI